MSDVASRQLPCSPDLELRILGCVVNSPDEHKALLVDLTPDDFFADAHRRVFSVAQKLYAADRMPDPVLVSEAFPGSDGAELRNLISGLSFHHGKDAEAWGLRLRQLAVARRVTQAGFAIAAQGLECQSDPDAFADAATKQLSVAMRHRAGVSKFRDMLDVTSSAMNAIRDRAEGKATTFVSTGFAVLDSLLGGWENGRLYVVAARPGMGKSALAMQSAADVASRGHPVCAYSLEMKPEEIVYRFCAAAANIDSRAIARGRLNPGALIVVQNTMNVLSKLPLTFADGVDASIDQIRRDGRLQKAKGMRLLVVDYLQLVRPSRNMERGDREMADVSRGLKQMSLELDIPVIALSQLNRESTKRQDGRPRLEDLRESGAIEQDADAVLLLHRDPKTKEVCEVICPKNRAGGVGSVAVKFTPQFTRFADMEPGVWANEEH
jgi:replicative DNA helicase